MRQELKLHYFSQSQDGNSETDAEFTEEDLELKGYLCREVGIPSNDWV